MQAAQAHAPQPMDEVEEVKAAYLAEAHGDLYAAYEMLALAAVAELREYEGLVRRHVSRSFLRLPPALPRP